VGKEVEKYSSAKCKLADVYGVTAPKEFGDAFNTMEQVNLDHFEY
jgi:hypothetical protein